MDVLPLFAYCLGFLLQSRYVIFAQPTRAQFSWSLWNESVCVGSEDGQYRRYYVRRRQYDYPAVKNNLSCDNRDFYSSSQCEQPACTQACLDNVRIIGYSIGGILAIISIICALIYLRKRILRKRAADQLLLAASFSGKKSGRVFLQSTSSDSAMAYGGSLENDLYDASIPSPTDVEVSRAQLWEEDPCYEVLRKPEQDVNGQQMPPTREGYEFENIDSPVEIIENDIYGNVFTDAGEPDQVGNRSFQTGKPMPENDDESDYYEINN